MTTKNRKRIARATRRWSWTLIVAALVGMITAPAVAQDKPRGKTPGKTAGKPVVLPVKPNTAVVLKEVDPNAKQPIISPESPVHDFGTSWVGPKLEHTFKITNKGSEPLKIEKVRPSCGCTVAGAYPKELAPGATGEFPFSVNSKKLRGKYEKSITITSNDPVNSTIRLKLRGECKRYVDVLPAAANFGRVYGSENQERVLKVTNNTEKPLELELDIPSDSKFDYKLVEVDAGMKYEIHVSLKASKTPGTLRTNAKLKTNVEAQKVIPIGATATIPKRLDVVPAQITLGAPRAGTRADKTTTRIVRINNYGETPINVLEATINDPKIQVTINARKEGKNYDLRLEIPQNFEASTANIRLLPNHTYTR